MTQGGRKRRPVRGTQECRTALHRTLDANTLVLLMNPTSEGVVITP